MCIHRYIYSSKNIRLNNKFLKYGSVGHFFPLNVVRWRSGARGGANLADNKPRWCGSARRGGANWKKWRAPSTAISTVAF